MKKNIILLSSLFSGGFLFSQVDLQPAIFPTKIDDSQIIKKGNVAFNQKAGGDVVYSETFNGSLGSWTTSGPDATVWAFDTDGPDGQYSSATNVDIITSTTAANGFAIFDADLSNPGPSSGFQNRSGSLVSPVIDLSLTPNVLISFQQDYRHCCNRDFFPAVQVSVDGFATFTTYDATIDGISTNDRAGTVLTSLNINDFLAVNTANLSNFQFRFNFDGVSVGTSHYYWQVDDVELIEQFPFELEASRLWLGDIFNDFELTETPADIAGTLTVQEKIKSFGISIPANVALRVRVLDALNSELFSNAGGVLSNNLTMIVDTITYDTGFDLSTLSVGSYTIETTIESTDTDGNLTNNILFRTLKITYNKLSSINFDEGYVRNSIGYAYGPRNPTTNAIIGSTDMIVGSIFYLPVDKVVTGFDIALSTGTTANPTTIGTEILLQIWEYMPDNPQDSRFEFVAGDYGYLSAANQLSAASTSLTYYTFDFNNSIGSATGSYTLTGGKRYLASLNNVGGESIYLWYWSTLGDDDYSSWVKGPFGANSAINWFTAGYDPLIKVNFPDPNASITEKASDIFNVSLFPNPSAENTTLHYSTKEDAKVSYEIVDLSGKAIFTSTKTSTSKGKNSFDINTANIENGVYSIRLNVNNSITNMKLIVRN
jgi:hypothetical protein